MNLLETAARSAAMFLCALLIAPALQAQIPTKCLEVESILVDACVSEAQCPASTEGMNEMVRFITGPDPIELSTMWFTFYSSAFRGISQNAITAQLTAELDASIQSCGKLLEPPGGVIPPGSRVIFVTSTQMCTAANPFHTLSDTLYIIYQNAGNSQGHFRNNGLYLQDTTSTPGPPLLRTFSISVNGPACGDTVAYDANRLVNIYGNYGGMPEVNDGATVNFAWPGEPLPTYINHGCMAPFETTVPTIILGGGAIDCGETTSLRGQVDGDHISVLWQGGTGSFSDPTELNTTYTPGGGDQGEVELSFCAITDCQDTLCTTTTLTILGGPEVTVAGDTTLCSQFDTALLTASGADSYLWSTGETGPSIVAGITGPMDYWVVGTNACGSDTAHIAPRWMSTTTYYTNVSCHGAADGELSAEGSGGLPPYTYLWSTGSTDPVITNLAPGPYSYTITDANGCTKTGSTTITEPPLLTAAVGPDTTICPGGTATLQATGDGGSPGSLGTYYYTWSPEGPVVSPEETTTYTVVVSDLAGCETDPLEVTVTVSEGQGPGTTVAGDTTLCSGSDTSVLTASGADSYLWSTGETGPSIVAESTGPMAYWVVGTNACGSDTAHIAPRWMNTTTHYTNVSCHGAADGELSAEGTAGLPPYTYLWSTGSTDPVITNLAPGPYSYTITDANGCTKEDAHTITEPDPLVVIPGNDTIVCDGGAITLMASASGGTPEYLFSWSPDGPVVAPIETTVYTVGATDANGCEALPEQMTVTVLEREEPMITTTPLDGCAPHCITFTATADTPNSYIWDFGDGGSVTDSLVENCYADPGEYTVQLQVTFANGCPDAVQTIGPFNIHEPPVAAFEWEPEEPNADNPQVQFIDQSTGALGWNWHFGDPDGHTAMEASPSFTFPAADCFLVSLAATGENGCADSTSAQVCVKAQEQLVVPNVITPNGDGVNDVFRVSGGNLTALDVRIFNRWGQLVAWLERVNQVWDGRSPAGELLSEGTYFYTLQAEDGAGQAYDRSGTILLIR